MPKHLTYEIVYSLSRPQTFTIRLEAFRETFCLFGLCYFFITACGDTPKVGDQPLTQQRDDELKVVAQYLTPALIDSLRVKSSTGTNLTSAATSGDCGPSTLGLTDADTDGVTASCESTYKDCTEDKFWWIEVKNGAAAPLPVLMF